MSTTRRKRKSKKKNYILPLAAGLLVVCGLVAGIAFLESALDRNSQPAEPTTQPRPTLEASLYGPGDFSYDEKGYLALDAGEYQLGVDVSDHQQEIDWQTVASAGIQFAFVRIGYRGYSEGNVFADEQAAYNLTNAKAAGLQVGAYFYSQAVNAEEAAQEAAFCVEYLKDHPLDLPVVFDWEYVSESARTGLMDTATLNECAEVFCSAIEAAGYEAMVYFNPDLAQNLYDLTGLDEYPFWLAMYTDQMTYPYRVEYWQYTDSGTVPGIEGGVDLNLRFLD